MARIVYDPLPFQEEFHCATDEIVILSGGYGCGKTYSLVQKIFQLCNENRGVPGGILCPDLKMFKRDVMPEIRNQLLDAGLYEGRHYQFNKQDMVYRFPQTASEVYVFHGKDHGASIRGPTLGWFAINEVTLISEDTYEAAVGRVRAKKARMAQIAMSGTPEGFNWFHSKFIENPKDNVRIIYGNTRSNTHLRESYVKLLMSQYDELMQKAYIDGEFINLTGNRAAWAFARQKHVVDVAYDENLPVWISLDFNVNPMSAVLWNVVDENPESIHLRAFDEICLKNSNTFKLAEAIRERMGEKPVTLFPDPAGTQRNTASIASDIQILENAGFSDIRFKKRIASVKNCLNAMNNILGNHVVEISPQCKNLIQDCEKCVLADDLTIDKSDPMRSHWLDGFKNMCDYEFPIARPNVKVHVTRYA